MKIKEFFRKLFKKKTKTEEGSEKTCCCCGHSESAIHECQCEECKCEEKKEEPAIEVEATEENKTEVLDTPVINEELPPIIEVVIPEQVETVEVEPGFDFPLLSMCTVAELRDICRERGITGFSTKKKAELIPFIYATLTVPDLKGICKFRGIAGYSTKKKDELIEMIISSEK